MARRWVTGEWSGRSPLLAAEFGPLKNPGAQFCLFAEAMLPRMRVRSRTMAPMSMNRLQRLAPGHRHAQGNRLAAVTPYAGKHVR